MERSNTPRPFFEAVGVLGDVLRCRLLTLLEGRELTVSELCQVVQLPQSTVSRHLRTLATGGWVTARRDGTSRRYRASIDERDETARQIWQIAHDELVALPVALHDRRRLAAVLARRRSRSQEFFSSAAERWAQLRQEMFGPRFDLEALALLLDPGWTVGDLGCGTGQLAEALSGGVKKVIAVDGSEAMLQAARDRLDERANVELRPGDLGQLPLRAGELDAATLVLVLHHLADPAVAVAEAARTLKPGGRLLIVDMLPHEREEYRQEMGHLWLGFEPRVVAGWCRAAGLGRPRTRALPSDAGARGPALFAAVAAKRAASKAKARKRAA